MVKERLELDLSAALSQLNRLDAALRSATQDFSKDLNRAVSQVHSIKIDADAKGVTREIDRAVDAADTSVRRFHSNIGGVNGSLGALGQVGVGVFHAIRNAALLGATALVGLGSWGLKSAAEMQQVEIAFEGIFQSGTKSAAFLDQLRAFAAKTPFEFPELARSAKMLLATGTNAADVIPIMTKLGNVAATLGVGGAEIEGVVRALGQMKGKGKASAEELQQISEQIPGFSAIGAIAQSMGITTAEAFDKMEKGAITADQAIAAILTGMDKFPGAAGAMERQSKTLLGVLSTFKDTARDALIGGISGALPEISAAINTAMPEISKALGSLGKTFGTLMQSIVKILPVVLPVFAKLADAVGGLLTQVFSRLGPLIERLAPIFDRLLTAVGPLITALLDAFIPVLETLTPSILELVVSLVTGLVPVIITLQPLLLLIAEAIAGVLGWINDLGPAAVLAGALLAVAFSGMLGPVGLVALAILGIGAAFSAMGLRMDEVYENEIVPILNKFIGGINEIIGLWNDLFGWLGLGIGKVGEIERAADSYFAKVKAAGFLGTGLYGTGPGGAPASAGGLYGTGPGGAPGFAHGGIVGQGSGLPIGTPQMILAHVGERVLTTGQTAGGMGIATLNVNVMLSGDGASNPAVLAGITGAVERGVGSLSGVLRDIVVTAGTG